MVELDLRAIAASSIDKCCLLHFLLARVNGREVILEVMRTALDDQAGQDLIPNCLTSLP